MKKVFCSQYENVDCCDSCHREDEFYKSTYKDIQIVHCCSSHYNIRADIDKHSDEPLEDNCD